jgi:hypothetical protein
MALTGRPRSKATGQIHIVTTRYNASLYGTGKTRHRIAFDPDEWMRARFRLFSTFTLPSLRGQSCQDFRWFVFIDPATPRDFRQQLEDTAGDCPQMEIVPLEESVLEFLKREIASSGAGVALTSRIDNDDAWDRDYVKWVQGDEIPLGRVVDFQDSYWLDVEVREIYHCKVRWWTDPQWWRFWQSVLRPRISNSPTVVETAQRPRTVYAANHRELVDVFGRRAIEFIPDKPYRLVTCHEHNLLNRIGGREGRFTPAPLSVLDRFSIPQDYQLD